MEQQVPRLKAHKQGDVVVVELVDRKILDESNISQISAQLAGLAAKEARPNFVLDFLNVSHMSSSALGMLITLHKRVREKSGQLRLCNIRPSIYEVFVITRLNEVLRICPTRDEAIKEASAG
jgi:anti-sigma B factor antagonist